MAIPAIKMIPTPFDDVMTLLNSDALRAIEQPIATAVKRRIFKDYISTLANSTQAEISVSGMSVVEIEIVLLANRELLIRFGAAFLRDEAAMDDTQEYPEGEEQDPPENGEVLGLAVGFGITYAIYYNFLANRTPADFQAYLKYRRMPHAAKFARELRRVFDSVRD